MSKRSSSHEAFEQRLREAVLREWQSMITEGTRYEIGDMEFGEEGPAELRSRLEPDLRDASLTQVRRAFAHHNKNGRAAKHGSRHASHPAEKLRRSAKANHSPSEHSPEYERHIKSQAWAQRAREHKRACTFRCQLCGRIRLGDDLHVHHIHYESLGSEDIVDLLCVCGDGCHEIADIMREWGKEQKRNPFSL